MKIDLFYDIENEKLSRDKSYFYLGKVSEVYTDNFLVQTENLTLLRHRKIKQERINPNTINFLVTIDSNQGIFIGEVYQSTSSAIKNIHGFEEESHDSQAFAELKIRLLGLFDAQNLKFRLPGFQTVGIGEKVYVANERIISMYVEHLAVHNHKQQPLEGLAALTYFDDIPFNVKPNTIFDRHLIAIGSTNSGKSTSALAILDKMFEAEKKILIIDPSGEYRDSFNDKEFRKLTLGDDTTISPAALSMQQWCMLFDVNEGTQPAILADAIKSLRFQKKEGIDKKYIKKGKVVQEVDKELSTLSNKDLDFDLNLLPEQINEESVKIGEKGVELGKYIWDNFRANTNSWLVQKVLFQLNNTKLLNFFTPRAQNDSNSTNEIKTELLSEINHFVADSHEHLYLDASSIGSTDGVGAMIVDLICQRIGKKQDVPKAFIVLLTRFIDILLIRCQRNINQH